jgi:hypothetical protein
VNGRWSRSTSTTSSVTNSGPEPLGLGAHVQDQLRAHDAVGEAGVVLDVGGQRQLPAGRTALDHALDQQRLEVGAGGVDGGGQPGGAGADDDDVVDAVP